MDSFRPIARRKRTAGFWPRCFKFMNHVEKLIHGSILSSGSVLIRDRMYRHARLDARQEVANLSSGQGLDNC